MDSRYALRELQCAIGYDCRRLHDGRTASFRHTRLHRRAKRDYYERMDALLVISASLQSVSSISSHNRMKITESLDVISNERSTLLKVAFPYAELKNEPKNEERNYDKYFDELDEMTKEVQKGPSGESGESVGQEAGK